MPVEIAAAAVTAELASELLVEQTTATATQTIVANPSALDLLTGKVSPETSLKAELGVDPVDVSFDNEVKMEQLKMGYLEQLENLSPNPDWINMEGAELTDISNISPQEMAQKRQEFLEMKDELKAAWETENGVQWPKYENDLFSKDGQQIAKAGTDLEVYHIQPLEMGGENVVKNITPGPINADLNSIVQEIRVKSSISQLNLDNFRLENWNKMDLDERMTALKDFQQKIAEIQGIPSCEVTFTEMPENQLGGYIQGSLSSGNGQIELNANSVKQTSPIDAINTIAHETYHSYQEYAISHPEIHGDMFEVESWRINSLPGNYIDPSEFDPELYGYTDLWDEIYDLYRSQPLESSAFSFGDLVADTVSESTGFSKLAVA
jgi:hypothetical protein